MEIEPYFQPIISPSDGRLHGAEVLARLRLPAGEVPADDATIRLAESAGLTLPLTEALFERLIDYRARLRPLNLAFLAVKLSATALDDQPSVALIKTLVLVRTLIDGLAGCCQLRVVLTEAAAIADSRPRHGLTAQISRGDASPVMDGVGAGSGSIRTLTELPFDTVKIDPSFLAEMFDSTKARRLLLAIITLGRGLGLKVVAAGVETPTQQQVLIEPGAAMGHDHRCGPPMDINTFVQSCGETAGAAGGPPAAAAAAKPAAGT
ncbi:MAG TPA: EAL domain-containing protein [Lamprocystis sp. (in: g-proteobacteria)]|nr:EAL domain-containing protein [Lamprocystis sp. (in: g-proteobacteria)]